MTNQGAHTLHLNGCKYTLNKRGQNGNIYTRNYNGCNVATPYIASAAAATVPTLPSLQTALQLASWFVRICCICALIVCEYLVYMCLSKCCFTCLHLWAFVIGICEHLQVVLWIPNVCLCLILLLIQAGLCFFPEVFPLGFSGFASVFPMGFL